MRRIIILACLLVCGVVAGGWYYLRYRAPDAAVETAVPADENTWIDQLYSQNPTVSSAAAKYVEQLGPRALPMIHTTLQDPAATPEHVKAALKACGILGPAAASAIGEVAEQLPDPALTAEAAIALSFMGPEAFGPLRESLASDDPIVRREALRSIGKLKERAPLQSSAVVPLGVARMTDADPGIRSVAATYLGIIHEGGSDAVSALATGLQDPEVQVRLASATALGSFGPEAEAALPALRKAASDSDAEVAREAGVTLVKLQGH
ncbi:MAG: HEAT repeat domain-containing protein [Acidobacteriota bacterium]